MHSGQAQRLEFEAVSTINNSINN